MFTVHQSIYDYVITITGFITHYCGQTARTHVDYLNTKNRLRLAGHKHNETTGKV